MKRYEFNDSHDNRILVHESVSDLDKGHLWMCVDGKRFENNEMKNISVATILNLNQAKVLITSLQDLVDKLEKSNEKV